MRFIYLLFLLPFTASAQCDPEGILLELQATTDLNGLLFGETGCIEAVTIGSPLTFTGGTLDITTGNLTAGSTKVAVTGGTGAVIGSGSTIDVVPGNILLSTLGGSLNLSQIAQGGATTNQLLQWNGTTWAPATISTGSGTVTSVGLSLPSIFSVSGSPVTTSGTLTGTLATQSANTIFAGPTTGSAATPTFRALVAADIPALSYAAPLSGVSGQVPYFNSTSTITTESGSGANNLTWDATNNLFGIGTSSPAAVINTASPVDVTNLRLDYTYKVGNAGSAISVLNQDNLETFNLGANRTSNEGQITLRSPSVQGGGSGINFSSNNGATANTALFQLDNSGNLVFRQGKAGASMFYDFGSGVYFRNSSFSQVNHINSSGWLSIAAGNTHPRALYVNGEARIADLTTDTPTGVVGADADGDLGLLAFSGMSIISGTLTATDPSLSNEGVLGVGAGSGTSSTLLSTTSGASAVTINAAGILAITESTSSNGGSITLTATEVDGSTTNELQTIANTSASTTHTATLSNSGGSLQLAEGAGITLTTTGTTLDGIVTIASAGPTGSGAAGQGTYWTGTNTIAGNAAYLVDVTNGRIQLNTTGSAVAPTAHYDLRVGTVSGNDIAAHLQGSVSNDWTATLYNTRSAAGGANSIWEAKVAATTSGDPFYRAIVTGGETWSWGADNSDADKFKLRPQVDLATGATGGEGLTITAAVTPLVGINTDAPAHPLDVNGIARALTWTSRTDATGATSTFGLGAGGSPSLFAAVYPNGNMGTIRFTTGSSPTANAVIVNVVPPAAVRHANKIYVTFSPLNAATAGEIDKFYIDPSGTTPGNIAFKSNGALTAATEYYLSFIVMGHQ